MPVPHETLRTPITQSESLDVVLAALAALGFELTSWHSGSIQRTAFTVVAGIGADFAKLVSKLAGAPYNSYATGAPLREYSRSSYDNEPQIAQKTIGPIKLTASAAAGYTIGVGALIASTETGVEFTNTTGGVLSAGGTLSPTFTALLAGAAGNVPNLAIKVLKTPLAGVTISNIDNGSGVWYTTSGADQDPIAKLRTRNRTRWKTLNQIAMPGDGYVYLALTIAAITRVYVDDQNPRGPNTLDVYAATANGPASGAEIAALQALFNIKKPPSVSVLAKAPTNKTVTVTGQVNVAAALNTPAKLAAIKAKIDQFIQSFPIGGVILPPSTSRIIPHSELIGAITAVPGVVGVTLTSPTTDIAMTPVDLAIPGVNVITPVPS